MRYWPQISVLLLSVFLASCFGPVAPPPMTSYRLEGIPPAVVTPHGQRSLLVVTPTTVSNLKTRAMLYTEGPYQAGSFAINQWQAPPAQMLLPLIVTHLQNSGGFSAVVAQPFTGATDLRLTTQLLIFQQEFSGSQSQFHLEMVATLVSVKTNQIMASRRFSAFVTAPEPTPYGGVVAANRAVAQILQQLTQWCLQTPGSGNRSHLPSPHWSRVKK